MSENGEIYTAGKSFTLPPAVTALINSTSAGPMWGLILGNSMNSQERFSLFVDADEGGRQLTGIKIGTGKIRRLDFENFKKIPGPRDIPKYCQRVHLTFPYCKLFVIFMFFVKFGKQDGKPITVYKGYNLISSAKFREEIRQGPCFREAVKEISIKYSRIQMLRQDDNGFCAEFFFGTYIMSLIILFIGPESDHWQCLSLTNSLTHSLRNVQ